MSTVKQLYLLRFETCDNCGKYLYDEIFLVYAVDEIELQTKITEIATTKAQGKTFLGAEKRVYGLTIMHEHVPATIMIEAASKNGTQE